MIFSNEGHVNITNQQLCKLLPVLKHQSMQEMAMSEQDTVDEQVHY